MISKGRGFSQKIMRRRKRREQDAQTDCSLQPGVPEHATVVSKGADDPRRLSLAHYAPVCRNR
ncbi:hypothetical protein CN878_11155 [Ochrobactrum sp. 695/2009]|nr:hypothetical protein CN881_16335 [Ochrobactrum sp. 721/2009]PJT16028.1 hypothetical protein CN880_06395 [Ochrobactrum sp. 720/2009]PJT25848.1 hypothetical protein CN879_02360 [Ochrobactrum sp. 715/2009]PJT29454.1 hypothetical protein CN878_11155 [Ochrobactrum sp. 695/2009]PJT35369.1 hypothetical protein CN877_04810 [Ochrobactrum sp. 689/2009]